MNYPIKYILLAFHFVYESEEIISHLLTSACGTAIFDPLYCLQLHKGRHPHLCTALHHNAHEIIFN